MQLAALAGGQQWDAADTEHYGDDCDFNGIDQVCVEQRSKQNAAAHEPEVFARFLMGTFSAYVALSYFRLAQFRNYGEVFEGGGAALDFAVELNI